MGIKKNVVYNGLLTVSQYLFPFITFPYISRVLGATNIGLVNFFDSILSYFILFSFLGINTLGVREIAKHRTNQNELNKTFSEIIIIHLSTTAIILVIYFLAFLFIPQLSPFKNLFFLGIVKILFSLFLIEWLFRGTENFRYITQRSIAVNLLYVILIFVFVKNRNDYFNYYALTIGVVVINAFLNSLNARRIVRLTFKGLNIRKYILPIIILGLYSILTSMYTTFNVSYLGFVSNNEQVGYYTIASKIQTIVLGLFSAFSIVMMPRMSYLIASKDIDKFRGMLSNSFNLLFTISLPLFIGLIMLAPEVIQLLSGQGYEKTILPLRIMAPLIFIAGLNQIFAIQILIPLNKNNQLLIASAVGAVFGIFLNYLLTNKLFSIGTAIIALVSECSVLFVLYYFSKKNMNINFPFKLFFKKLVLALPYVIICVISRQLLNNYILTLIMSLFLSIIYFSVIELMIFKNDLIINSISEVRKYYKKII